MKFKTNSLCLHFSPKPLTIHVGKNLCFTEFGTKIHLNARLAASDVFHMFTQSVTVDSLYLDDPPTLYLEYLSISNKIFGPLKFHPRTLHSLSLFRTSLSRTFPYIEQISRSLEPISLFISNIYVFEFHFRIPE